MRSDRFIGIHVVRPVVRLRSLASRGWWKERGWKKGSHRFARARFSPSRLLPDPSHFQLPSSYCDNILQRYLSFNLEIIFSEIIVGKDISYSQKLFTEYSAGQWRRPCSNITGVRERKILSLVRIRGRGDAEFGARREDKKSMCLEVHSLPGKLRAMGSTA